MMDHSRIMYRAPSEDEMLDQKFFLPYFESQLLRVFSGTINEMSAHFIKFHAKSRYSYTPRNQWNSIILSNNATPMRIEDIKNCLLPQSNFRGILFNILNMKAHELLRDLCELGRFGHKIDQVFVNEKRLQCPHIVKQTEKYVDDFNGFINEWTSPKSCDCFKYKTKNFNSSCFILLAKFVNLILKPDYLSEKTSFGKIVDILLIERVQGNEILGILTILSAIMNRSS